MPKERTKPAEWLHVGVLEGGFCDGSGAARVLCAEYILEPPPTPADMFEGAESQRLICQVCLSKLVEGVVKFGR